MLIRLDPGKQRYVPAFAIFGSLWFLILSGFLPVFITLLAPGDVSWWSVAASFFADAYLVILMLFLVHAVPFVTTFLKNKEYEHADLEELAAAPLARVLILQVTLVAGFVVGGLIGARATGLLIMLVGTKTLVDFFELLSDARTARRKAALVP